MFSNINRKEHFQYLYFYLILGISKVLIKGDCDFRTLCFWSVCILAQLAGMNLTFPLKSVKVLCIIVSFSPFIPLCKFNGYSSRKCTHVPTPPKTKYRERSSFQRRRQRPELCSSSAEWGQIGDVCNIRLQLFSKSCLKVLLWFEHDLTAMFNSVTKSVVWIGNVLSNSKWEWPGAGLEIRASLQLSWASWWSLGFPGKIAETVEDFISSKTYI